MCSPAENELLIYAAGHSDKYSINKLAKMYKVKPDDVRRAFDIFLSRQVKKSPEKAEQERQKQNEYSRKYAAKTKEQRKEYQREYARRNRERISERKRQNYRKKKMEEIKNGR